MGESSKLCEYCGIGIRGECAIGTSEEWMNDAVIIQPNGEIVKGGHDGFTAGFEYGTWYHKKCWEKIGCPTAYKGVSKSDPNQGWGDGEDEDDDA